MIPEEPVLIEFEEIELRRAQSLASNLKRILDELANSGNGIKSVELMRKFDDNQDIGSIISVVVTSSAAIVVARGICNYLSRAGCSVKMSKGKIEINNIRGSDAAKIVSAFFQDEGK